MLLSLKKWFTGRIVVQIRQIILTASNKSTSYTLMLRAMFENNPIIRVCPSCSVELMKHFSEVKIFLKLTNQKKELPTAAIIINESKQNEQS